MIRKMYPHFYIEILNLINMNQSHKFSYSWVPYKIEFLTYEPYPQLNWSSLITITLQDAPEQPDRLLDDHFITSLVLYMLQLMFKISYYAKYQKWTK